MSEAWKTRPLHQIIWITQIITLFILLIYYDKLEAKNSSHVCSIYYVIMLHGLESQKNKPSFRKTLGLANP